MERVNIGFVRRGFSPSGGAEIYLRRLARAIVSAGHDATLFATPDWPETEWPTIRIERVKPTDPLRFADELQEMDPWKHCDVLVSFERIWRCDFFRAGDGVHRAWLDRRAEVEKRLWTMLRRLNRKHAAILRLEKALLSEGGARRIIANSALVRDDIMRYYAVAADRIEVIRNGIRVSDFGPAPLKRASARTRLNLQPVEVALLFCGSGWERKGLNYAISLIEQSPDPHICLLVAGRGKRPKVSSDRVRFLGEMADVRVALAAADIFILPTIYDPFSNATLEAMAAGLPVITTRANGCSEIIDEKVHGSILERADDLAAMAAALRFWSNESRRVGARAALLERATQFDISRNVAHTLEVLFQPASNAALALGKIRNI